MSGELEDDGVMQAAVLGLLLQVYPAPLTIGEVVLHLATDPDDFGQRDDVERAVRDLIRAGLLHRHATVRGGTVFVFAARPAVCFAALPLP